MTLEEAIKHCEGVALQKDIEAEEHNPRYTGLIRECKECAAEHRQLAEWLKILKSAKFEYNEAWRIITHPTPDVTYADKQRAQMILNKFRNSLGVMK